MLETRPHDHRDVEAERARAGRSALWDRVVMASAEERFGTDYLAQRILILEAKLARIRTLLKTAIDLAASLDLAARTLLPDAIGLGFSDLETSCRQALLTRPSDRRSVGLSAVRLAESIADALASISRPSEVGWMAAPATSAARSWL